MPNVNQTGFQWIMPSTPGDYQAANVTVNYKGVSYSVTIRGPGLNNEATIKRFVEDNNIVALVEAAHEAFTKDSDIQKVTITNGKVEYKKSGITGDVSQEAVPEQAAAAPVPGGAPPTRRNWAELAEDVIKTWKAIFQVQIVPLQPAAPAAVAATPPYKGPANPTTPLETTAVDTAEVFNALKTIKEKWSGSDATTTIDGVEVTRKTHQPGNVSWIFTHKGKKYRVNEFEPGAYNGIMQEDFENRKQLLQDAVMDLARNKNPPVADDPKLKALNAELENLLQHSELQLQLHRMTKDAPDSQIKHYKKIHDRIQEVLAQYASNATKILGCKLSDIAEAEKALVNHRGRPTIINTFSYRNHRFISMQTPLAPLANDPSGTTIPSSMRNGPGLPNYVVSLFGEIAQDGTVTLAAQSIRHSSYPPIRIADQKDRREKAFQNVCKVLSDLVPATAPATRDDPAKVSLRTMMLFSPNSHGLVSNYDSKGNWTGEHEETQLEDCAYALDRCRHGPIQVNKDGRTIWIKADISFMNMGANPFWALPGAVSQFNKDINARGMVEYVEETLAYLESKDPRWENSDHGLRWLKPSTLRDVQEVKKNLEPYLQYLYEKRNEEQDATKIREYDSAIKSAEVTLRNAYVTADREQKKLFLAHKKEIDAIIRAAPPAERELVTTFLKMLQLYYEGTHTDKEHILEAQAQYVRSQQQRGDNVDFFCKSGKDRTGRLDDYCLEDYIRHVVGAALKDHSEIASLVHQYSASQDNTRENTASRGLQVYNLYSLIKLFPERTGPIEGSHAKLSKKIFDKAKELHPAESLDAALSRRQWYKALFKKRT